MDPDNILVFSRLSCMVMFLVPLVYSEGNKVDICASKTIIGTRLTIERKAGHDHTTVFCKCFIYNPEKVNMKMMLSFPRTRKACSEQFIIEQKGTRIFERCSSVNNSISVNNGVPATTTSHLLSFSYSWNDTREREQAGHLKLIVEPWDQRTNISVDCNPKWTTAAPTRRTTPDVTTSPTLEVRNPAVSSLTSNTSDITTAGPTSRWGSGDPPSMPRSVVITTDGQQGPNTTRTGIQGESKSVVGIKTFLIVIVLLSIVIFAFIIGAVAFFCRRKTPMRETDETETPVIYAEPDKSNRLPRPRSKPDESVYAASSDVSIEIPVPPKSWEVEGQIPRHSIMVENVVYDSQND